MNKTQSDDSLQAPWSHPDWQSHAMAWAAARLDAAGIRQTGPTGAPRVRPWATVIRIPTDHGDAWFKAPSTATAHEIAIYPLIARHGADVVLQPIAVDTDRSWILLPHGGTALRDIAAGDELVDHWVRVIGGYARLQRSLMTIAGTLPDLGIPDMRPQVMPARFDEGVEIARAIVEQSGSAADHDTMKRIEAFRPTYHGWCEELGSSPVPATLDHSDLHGGSVLIGSDGRRACLIDWGDSVAAAPFGSLLVLLRTVQDALGCSPDDRRLLRIRDAYLDVFSDMGNHADLVRMVEVSCRVSKVIRALTWARSLALDPSPNPDWVTAPFIWMSSVTEDHYLD